jgi:hypothetical protein
MGTRTPNDDRSDVHNPTSSSYQASMDNRAAQLDPNNERYGGAHQREEDDDE